MAYPEDDEIGKRRAGYVPTRTTGGGVPIPGANPSMAQPPPGDPPVAWDSSQPAASMGRAAGAALRPLARMGQATMNLGADVSSGLGALAGGLAGQTARQIGNFAGGVAGTQAPPNQTTNAPNVAPSTGPIGNAQAAEVPQGGQYPGPIHAPSPLNQGMSPEDIDYGGGQAMPTQGMQPAMPTLPPLASNAALMSGPAGEAGIYRYETPGGGVGYQNDIGGEMRGVPSGRPGAGVDRFAAAYNPNGGTLTTARGAAGDMPGYDQLTNDQKIQANVAKLNQQRMAIRDLNAVRKAQSYYGLPEGQRGRIPNDVADAMGVARAAPRSGGRDVIGGADWQTSMQDYASGRVGSEGYKNVRNMIKTAQSDEDDRARAARRKLGRRSKYGVAKDMTGKTLSLIGNMANKEMGINAAVDKAGIQATQSGLQRQADLMQQQQNKQEGRAYNEERDRRKEERKAVSDEKKAAGTAAAKALTSGRKEINKLLPITKNDLGEVNVESQANNIAAQSAYDRLMKSMPNMGERVGEASRRIAQAYTNIPSNAQLEAAAKTKLGPNADPAKIAKMVGSLRKSAEDDIDTLMREEFTR